MNDDEIDFCKKVEEKKSFSSLLLEKVKKNSLKKTTLFLQDDCNFTDFNPFSEDEISYPCTLFSYLDETIRNISEENQSFPNKHEKSDNTSTKDEVMIRDVCKGFLNQPYKLVLKSDIERPMYKDRVFSLVFEVIDYKKDIIKLENPIIFSAFLYTTTSPIQKIEFTQRKDKIITGTTVVESFGLINFRKLVIREVSSYQKDGIFTLVILPEDSKLIQPYIIKDITVKARKMKLWKLKKNLKIDKF